MATSAQTLNDPVLAQDDDTYERKSVEDQNISTINNNEPSLSETIAHSTSTNQIVTPTNSNLSQTTTTTKPKNKITFKVLILGEVATGKTALVKQYTNRIFSEHYQATTGIDFHLKILNYDDETVVHLQLWNIAGQERFGNMTRVYYKEAVGCFIVFDVTRDSTFEFVTKWKTDFDNKVQLPNGRPVPCVLIANKCDLAKKGLVNNPQQMDEFCHENGFIGWFETSAKENTNIEQPFRHLIDEMIKRLDEPQLISVDNTPPQNTIQIKKKRTSKKRNKLICFCGRGIDSD